MPISTNGTHLSIHARQKLKKTSDRLTEDLDAYAGKEPIQPGQCHLDDTFEQDSISKATEKHQQEKLEKYHTYVPRLKAGFCFISFKSFLF